MSESRLEEAIFVVICDAWPTKPRFHVFETRPFRAAAIYEYGVYQMLIELAIKQINYINNFK